MSITASLVSELRERTGVGLMDCKKVLVESNGNLDEAIKILREKGLAKAAKKGDRSTGEGRIFVATNNTDKQSVILILNCETDFVASNDVFHECGQQIAQAALTETVSSIDDIKSLSINSKNFTDYISEYVLKLGENITVGKVAQINNTEFVEHYIHMNGKIGVLVAFNSAIESETAKSIAMHIAAVNPNYLTANDVPQDELDNEKEIIRSQSIKEGKPEAIIDKIIQGRLSKYQKEVCLLEQAFIKDDKKQVKELLNDSEEITGFYRFSLS